MKKMLLLILLIILLLTSSVSAAEYYMSVTETEEYSYADSIDIIGRTKDGGLIPISSHESGHYLYAWINEGETVQETYCPKKSFADILNEEYEYGASYLGQRGVIVGYEDGTFRGDDIITRAEAAVMLSRIGRLSCKEGSVPYKDISENSWLYQPIEVLHEAGVVSSDTLFYPERAVTREELTAMTWRLISAINGSLGNTDEIYLREKEKVKDLDSVSGYAKNAYIELYESGYQVIHDTEWHDDMDFSDDEYFLKPQQEVTRRDAADFLAGFIQNFIRTNSPAIPKASAKEYHLDIQMPVIDGSTSTHPITERLYWMLFENGANHEMYPRAHSKTTAAYENLINGTADIIIVPDASSEIIKMAEEKGVELVKTPIAAEGFVFFTGKDNQAENISSDDIEKIYVDNAVTNWSQIGGSDASFAAFCRNNDSGSHAQMEKFFLKGRDIHPDIKRERTSVMMSSILTDVEEFESNNPGTYALGYSMYFYYQQVRDILSTDNLKLLSVDGVAPNDESIADGSYPLAVHYYAVTRADMQEDSPAGNLLKFLKSSEGRECLESSGFKTIY